MSDMGKGKITTNLFYNMIYQILILIVPFVTSPYVSRVLHPEGLGTYSVTTAIAKYSWMFALLGMSNYGNRAIAVDRDDKENLSFTFSNLFYFQMLISFLVFAIYIIYVAIIGYPKYDIVAICQIPYVLSALFEVSWFFYGTEQFRFMVLRNSIVKVVTAAAVFVFVKSPSDVWIYALINSISLLLGQLCLWPFLLKQVKLVPPDFNVIKTHFKPNLVLFISVLAVSIYTLMDKIMIELLSERVEVGYYENTEKMLTMCDGIVGAIGAVMLPRISYLMGKGNQENVHTYLMKSMKYVMSLAIGISFGLAGIAKEFSIVYFGDEFSVCGPAIMVISIAVLFYSWENILRTQYLLPGNRDKVFVKGTIYAAITNLLLNWIFIPLFGALGAVIGTVGAQVSAAVYQSVCVRKELPLKRYLYNLVPGFLCGTLMFLLCRLIGNIMGIRIITIVVQVIGGAGFYIVSLGICFLISRDELMLRIIGKR